MVNVQLELYCHSIKKISSNYLIEGTSGVSPLTEVFGLDTPSMKWLKCY